MLLSAFGVALVALVLAWGSVLVRLPACVRAPPKTKTNNRTIRPYDACNDMRRMIFKHWVWGRVGVGAATLPPTWQKDYD